MRIISISSLKGGVGKTSVTLGLASSALHRGIPTLVVDLDPHADSTTGLGVTELPENISVGRMLTRPSLLDPTDIIFPSSWETESMTNQGHALDVMAGDAYSSIYERSDISRRTAQKLANALNVEDMEYYDLVLIDTPPTLNGLTKIAWYASDYVYLVTEPALFSVSGTERAIRALDDFRNDFPSAHIRLGGIIINKLQVNSVEQTFRYQELEELYGSLILKPAIIEFDPWQQIQGAAYSPHSWPTPEARAFSKNFDALLEHIFAGGGKRGMTTKVSHKVDARRQR